MLDPYAVLPLFATRFDACIRGIRVPLMQPTLFEIDINVLHGRFIIRTDLDKIYEHAFYICAIWDKQVFSLGVIAVLTQNPTVLIFVDINEAPKL